MPTNFSPPSDSEIESRQLHEGLAAEILRDCFMRPLQLSCSQIARSIRLPRRRAEFLKTLESFLADPGVSLDLHDCLILDRFFGLRAGWFWRLLGLCEVLLAVSDFSGELDKIRPLRRTAVRPNEKANRMSRGVASKKKRRKISCER